MKTHSITRLQATVLVFMGLVLLSIVFSITFMRPALAAALRAVQPKPTLRSAYDPAQFGIPDTLAGYRVIGVFTAENTACMQPGEKELMIQTQIVDLSDHLDQVNTISINQALADLGINPEGWRLHVWGAGPAVNAEEIFAWRDELNAELKKYGCGKPFLTFPEDIATSVP